MKLKVYKLAAMALVCLTAMSTRSFAQQSSSNSSSSTPAAPAAPQTLTGTYNFIAPPATGYSLNNLSGGFAPLELMDGQFMAMGIGTQDTIYNKKMQKLQEQMTELRKQMSTLRTEELKKNNIERQKAMAERMATQSKAFNESFKNFDKSFFSGDKFAVTSNNMRLNFNTDKTEDLDKKVASGEYKSKSKTYTKSYIVDGNDKINIENHYGKVTVNTWAKNEVKVDVEIKAYANEEDDAQKLLDQVKINNNKDNAGVSFVTVIGDENKNNFWGTWTSNGKTTIRKTIINYTVYMPAKSALTLSNSYGAVILPELSGKVMVKNSYGSLTSKGLTNSGNTVDVRYGATDIETFGGGDLNVSYGSLNLPVADKLNAVIRYSPAKIGKLSTSGVINLHYGDGLQIGNLDKNLKSLLINSQYAPVKVATLNNDNADFDVTVHYGGFTYNNGVSVTSKTPDDNNSRWSSTQTYKGHIGKGSPDKLITIKTNYSSVKFDQ